MSYILDALKRAQNERERGSVPGLHSQSADAPPAAEDAGRYGLWLVVLGLLAGLVAVAWLIRNGSAEPAALAPMPSQAEVPAPAAAAPPTVVITPQVTPAQTLRPVERPAQASTDPARTPLEASRPSAKPAPTAAVPTAPAVPDVDKSPAVSERSAQAQAQPTKAPQPASSAPIANEMPASLRSLVPPLRITGAVYAQDPAQRLLLINNQLLRQGDKVRPDLTLEAIEAKSAVFNYQGERFRLSY